ncbi:hypothetical protein FKM82_013565 [Ascaphus truei]|uniref:transmembrane protein 51 n=1 Tax=Ascaphus truei TaxID=8439 RepID=UPI003F5905EB
MAQSKSNGSHYALTAIGVGLLILGVVMAVWNLVPGFGNSEKPPAISHANSSKPETNGEGGLKSKTFSVAYVLVGSGIALLIIAICMSIRSKRKQARQNLENARNPQEEPAVQQANSESPDDHDTPRFFAPSYEEVMRIGYDSSNTTEIDRDARMSISLPSYESLTELDDSTPTRPNSGPAMAEQPQRTNSRSGKGKKPLNVRRIKSEKLHLKEFRLNLSGKSKETKTIEPLTPPPQYDGKPLGGNSANVETN